MDFIVAAENGIEVECLYSGYRKEDLVSNQITLQYGDTLTIENHGKYIVDVGWFVLITINNKVKEYMSASDLQEYIHANEVVSPVDCMLEYFSVSYQLDQALEKRDKATFFSLSEKTKALSDLYNLVAGTTSVHT